MISSKSKLIPSDHIVNLAQCRYYRTPHFPKPKTKTSNQKPRKARASAKRLERQTPFVSHVKETQDPEKALSLFHEYRQMGIKHDYPSYSSLLYKLARCGDFEAVETVLGYLQDNNVQCQETLFVALFEHYGKAHLVDKAIELFHKMTKFNCNRTRQSFCGLLNVLVDNDRFLDAKELFSRCYKMGFRLNSVPFNIMMKGWLQKGELGEACKVFDEMLERKIEPTVVTYNSLIGHLCRNKELEKAREFFKDMIAKGKSPNVVTYALLMEGLCREGEYNEAKKVMFDMEYRGCKPKAVNFGVLMSDLGRRGKVDEAKSLLLEMKKRRLKPDVVIYNILVNYLCKEGRMEEAYKTLIEMQIGGCVANAATYRTLVDGFCRAGDFEGGLKVLNAMLVSGHCPRVETFSCMISGLVKSGNVTDACFVIEEMEKRDMRFGMNGWEGIVRHCCGEDGAAFELVNEIVFAT